MSAVEPPEDVGGAGTGERSRRRNEANSGDVEPRKGPSTETVIFAVMGVAFVLAGIVYGFLDPYGAVGGVTGEVLFIAGGAFAFIAAGYFHLELRKVQDDVEADERERAAAGPDAADDPDAAGLYLPETSIWPLAIGVGTALTLLGVPLKWWFLLPGVALLGYGFIGFAHQSRTRG